MEKKSSSSRKVVFLGDYLPRKCGLAIFTTGLRCAVAAAFPAIQRPVVPVNDLEDATIIRRKCASKSRSRLTSELEPARGARPSGRFNARLTEGFRASSAFPLRLSDAV